MNALRKAALSRRASLFAALAAAVAVTASASASTVVVPGAYANTAGNTGLNTLTRDANNPRTYQMIISASNLASVPVGSILTGVQWRANITTSNPPVWPPADYSYNYYDMWLAPAALPVGSMSTTFANNVGPGEVQVRSGPLTIPAGSFTMASAPGPSPWGYLITFTQGYVYTGGDLVFTARHPGANSTGALFLDSLTNTTAIANGVQTMTATTATATTGAASSSTIFQFTFIPGPSGLALLGVVGLLGRRRRR